MCQQFRRLQQRRRHSSVSVALLRDVPGIPWTFCAVDRTGHSAKPQTKSELYGRRHPWNGRSETSVVASLASSAFRSYFDVNDDDGDGNDVIKVSLSMTSGAVAASAATFHCLHNIVFISRSSAIWSPSDRRSKLEARNERLLWTMTSHVTRGKCFVPSGALFIRSFRRLEMRRSALHSRLLQFSIGVDENETATGLGTRKENNFSTLV